MTLFTSLDDEVLLKIDLLLKETIFSYGAQLTPLRREAKQKKVELLPT